MVSPMHHRLSRSARAAGSLALLTPFVFMSCFLLPQEDEIIAPPLAEPPEISYRTEAVSRGSLRSSIRAFGTFTYATQEDLFFERRGGRLKTIYVSVGDEISAGDLVADLYTNDVESEVVQAELQMRRAELLLADARAKDADPIDYELAVAQRDLARVRLDRLRDELSSARARGATADEVETVAGLVTEQEFAVRRAELLVERHESGAASLAVSLAELDLEAARLRHARLLEELDATQLRAPTSGVVTWVNRQAIEGEPIQAFQRILQVSDPSQLIFRYEGRDASEFSVGMTCTITVRDVEYPATVTLTPLSVPYDRREEFENTVHITPTDALPDVRAGTSATAQLILAERDDVLVLPKRAVQRYGTRRYVHVLVDGVRVERDVEVGLETATEVEIVRGLDEGEEVVLR